VIELTGPEIVQRDAVVRAEARLTSARGTETLWYEVDAKYGEYLTTTRLDGFAVAALLVAMERGEGELIVHGAISARLLHNLQRQLIPMWRLMNPHMHDVSVRPRSVESRAEVSAGGVVTGFSAGIDSFCTLADYLQPEQLPSYKLTHLLYCNVGNHGHGEGGRRLFVDRWNLLRDYESSVGLGIVRVDSNLDELLNSSFERTHIARNSSAVLLLQRLFSKYLVSSSYSFKDSFIGDSTDVAHADPAAVHLLSTESLECISTGCRYSRVEKTRRAITVPACERVLNVCNHPPPGARNCSRCYKCLRTLATLDLMGKLEQFGHVFDLELYRRRRFDYLMLLPGRTSDSFIREIYEFSKQPDAHVPRYVRLFHAVWPKYLVPYGTIRTVRRWAVGTRPPS
jgi:hypothetical protein